ncbi:MAG: fibrillarin-like pre-rRNA processing protein [Methanolobus sp.]|jgi:fibrillarin-like pre-rRNA processing protein|uniref:fibrillarin-like rRNA/tRNA 2'-O-methyltransferase n=1 Tax=Methanolobus sp. TaxID=1874737 RepID=UPI0024AC599B|nr:fibrillarin-like rRNA/tRNA 2'-O-methyltransferase [Methanolobus sp.]MDI3484900.1 fibrillarin-like pre-rRNA processing protein [Methanolobus sp.]MDK2832047.1 fibrillarin-like pre-rRNA processing protein [Methanolobus sp.]MDK2938017.1 fibrillarin-like pre-rRNA processing protein [Methanolobus sp.]
MPVRELSSGIYELDIDDRKMLATKNMIPGMSVYGERLITEDDTEFRQWDPSRSKLGAMLLKNFDIPIESDSIVLYLGAASGTTVSHVSDILTDGLVYAVEFSPRTMRDLIQLCDQRPNIIPILADANKPQSYAHIVEKVDVVFQDVAQPNQAEIAAINSKYFLEEHGHLMLSIKSRSIDTVASPKKVFKEEVRKLESGFDIEFEVLERKELDPFHEDHLGVVGKMFVDDEE